jgi:hypothetical protein
MIHRHVDLFYQRRFLQHFSTSLDRGGPHPLDGVSG